MSINKIFSFLVLIFSFVLIINLFRDIQGLIKAGNRLSIEEQKLKETKEENERLKRQKKYYESEAFLEEQIRDKLNMAKPGEKIVFLPKELTEKELLESSKSANEPIIRPTPNWQKWLSLFK